MNIKINNLNVNLNFGSSKAKAIFQPTTSNVLIDGGIAPSSWAEFSLSDFSYDDGVSDNLDYEAVASFVNPEWIAHDDEDHQLISVICPPYLGVSGGAYNTPLKVDFYLNGGSPLSITTPESSRGYECFSARLPDTLSQDINEIRAVVYYNKGVPRILQGIAEPTLGYNEDGTDRPGWTAKLNSTGVFVGKYTDYYVGPGGNDSNDGLSVDTKKASFAAVYTQANAHGNYNVRINNSFTRATSGDVDTDPSTFENLYETNGGTDFAVNAARPGRAFTDGSPPGDNPEDFVHRQFIPSIVRGGDLYLNSPFADEVHVQACYFKNVNLFIDTTQAEQDGMALRQSNLGVDQANRQYTDYIWFIADGCTIGYQSSPDPNGGNFGGVYEHSFFSEFGGSSFRIANQAGPKYDGYNSAYNCTLIGATFYDIKGKGVDTSIYHPPTINDVLNCTVTVNCHIYDVSKMIYPWGSIGSPNGAQAGEQTISYGQATDPDGNSLSYADAIAVMFAALDSRNPLDNAPTSLALSAYDKGFWPDYHNAQTSGGYIDIDMTNVSNYGAGTYWEDKQRKQYPGDPHFDIWQVNESRENCIIANVTLNGILGNYQGVFWGDNANIQSSAVWNLTAYHPANTESMYILTVGSADNGNGEITTPIGIFQHYGPGIDIDGASTANTVRSTFVNTASNSNVVQDCWIYDLNSDLGAGTIEDYVPNLSGSLNVVNRSDIGNTSAVGIAYTQVPFDF